jgi:hypothetical protein
LSQLITISPIAGSAAGSVLWIALLTSGLVFFRSSGLMSLIGLTFALNVEGLLGDSLVTVGERAMAEACFRCLR